MGKSAIAKKVSQLYRKILINNCSEYDREDLQKSAIVFSPHFDDETLGCGGIIFKKKQAGADINIVFMTDGSKSHKHLMPEDELSLIRQNEGRTCAESLGLDRNDVLCLNLEETKLKDLEETAIAKVKKILDERQPEEIFIPYSREPLLWSEDHLATTRIVKSALQLYDKNAIVYEYPIWFWFHWPWVELFARKEPLRSVIFKNTIDYRFGLRSLQDFKCAVYIGDILDNKRAALNQHKSQMTRLLPKSNWATLGDVSNGEFLNCFFQEHEIFQRYPFKSRKSKVEGRK